MSMAKSEAIARIQCDYGVNGVCVRPVSNSKWAVLHVDSINSRAEVIYSADTKEECDEVVRLAAKKEA